MRKGSPNTRIFASLTGRKKFPSEDEIIAQLALLSTGLTAPKYE